MDARGFGAGPRTSYRLVSWTRLTRSSLEPRC